NELPDSTGYRPCLYWHSGIPMGIRRWTIRRWYGRSIRRHGPLRWRNGSLRWNGPIRRLWRRNGPIWRLWRRNGPIRWNVWTTTIRLWRHGRHGRLWRHGRLRTNEPTTRSHDGCHDGCNDGIGILYVFDITDLCMCLLNQGQNFAILALTICIYNVYSAYKIFEKQLNE
ncbi:hypothetical protein V3C99_019055, partial [Haemonchus contortus]|uniref:Polyprotein n=1 Tax=Haemonchus contortus TaxID=6289 RepID=A0A7I4YYX9_HAECO